jgi:hypothetical protein
LSEERDKKWCVCPDAPYRGGISEYVAPDGAWNFFGRVSTNMPRLTALKKDARRQELFGAGLRLAP